MKSWNTIFTSRQPPSNDISQEVAEQPTNSCPPNRRQEQAENKIQLPDSIKDSVKQCSLFGYLGNILQVFTAKYKELYNSQHNRIVSSNRHSWVVNF